MGWKYNSKSVKCPIFAGVVKTTNGEFIGIQCKQLEVNLGFDLVHIFRMNDIEELSCYAKRYCKSCYGDCIYFRQYEMSCQK